MHVVQVVHAPSHPIGITYDPSTSTVSAQPIGMTHVAPGLNSVS